MFLIPVRGRGRGGSGSGTGTINKTITIITITILSLLSLVSYGQSFSTTTVPRVSITSTTFTPTSTTRSATDSTTALSQQQLQQETPDGTDNTTNMTTTTFHQIRTSPRVQSCLFMSLSMACHFGGYEFVRSAALALFTSTGGITGFAHPSAYPFAIGLVTPTTLALLYWYGTILKKEGPQKALQQTTGVSLLVLLIGNILIATFSSIIGKGGIGVGSGSYLIHITKAITALLFVFQNSYAHLIYTQQWSFLGSVMTPKEGTKWFTFIAGLSSVVCTITASCVSSIATSTLFTTSNGGLTLLIFLTCLTLGASMVCSNRAYQLSTKYGFDPSQELQQKQQAKKQKQSKKKEEGTTTTTLTTTTTATTESSSSNSMSSSHNDNETEGKGITEDADEESLMGKTKRMFQTSPTLAGLFCEVITFQALSTILNVCFVRQLRESIPIDGDRASFTGTFYSGVNGVSCIMQFFIFPLLRKYLEPQMVYRFLPLLLMPLLSYAAFFASSAASASAAIPSGLWIAAIAFFALKTTDYSIRNLANEMVYQPLDFEARYLGKEVIGVFANRFGKSGTSMILSGCTTLFGFASLSTRPLSLLAVAVGGIWSGCSIYLSQHVITNQQAEEQVVQRQQRRSSTGITTDATPTMDVATTIVSSDDSTTTTTGRIKED